MMALVLYLMGLIPVDIILLFLVVMGGIIGLYGMCVFLTKDIEYVLLELLLVIGLTLIVPSLFVALEPSLVVGPLLLALLPNIPVTSELAWVTRIVLVIAEIALFGIKFLLTWDGGWKTLKTDSFKDK